MVAYLTPSLSALQRLAPRDQCRPSLGARFEVSSLVITLPTPISAISFSSCVMFAQRSALLRRLSLPVAIAHLDTRRVRSVLDHTCNKSTQFQILAYPSEGHDWWLFPLSKRPYIEEGASQSGFVYYTRIYIAPPVNDFRTFPVYTSFPVGSYPSRTSINVHITLLTLLLWFSFVPPPI